MCVNRDIGSEYHSVIAESRKRKSDSVEREEIEKSKDREREKERERWKKRVVLLAHSPRAYINISSILLVIAGLRSRRRHYHHISGNVEICLYVFGGKNNAARTTATEGRRRNHKAVARAFRGRLLVRDLLSMGKMIPAVEGRRVALMARTEYCSRITSLSLVLFLY